MASRAFDICFQALRPDGSRVAYIDNAGSNVLLVDFRSPNALPNGTSDLVSFLDHFDNDPIMAEYLPEARRDIGEIFEAEEGNSLRVLRMRKGLSQAELAAAISTSQAAISAIENRSRKPGEDNIRDLARVLEVDFNTLFDALAND